MSHNNRAAQIAAELQQRISGMRTGERLPGARQLATEFRASAGTISSALATLTALGLILTEPGRGTFVASRAVLAEPDFTWQTPVLGRTRVDPERASRVGAYAGSDHIPLSWGYLSAELLPTEELRQIGARAARSSRAWVMTPPTGSAELRRLLSADYQAEPSDVLVVAGGQQGLVFAMRTLAEPGDTIIMESPTYPGAIIAAQSAGLAIKAVPSDGDGILVDRLRDELERTRARSIYLQPNYANPTGAVLSPERRTQVLELAARAGAFIVEDDWARHLGIESSAPAPLFTQDPHGHVVSVLTLSKPASPGIRLGAVIARGPAGDRLRASRTADDLGVSPIVQEIALELLTSPVWPRHLKRLRSALAHRRDALAFAIASSLPAARVPHVPRGGLHLWAQLPHGTDTREFSAAAHSAGVLVGDGRHFFVDEPPSPFLRLSFGAATEPQIAEGVRRLAALSPTTLRS
ncbi:Transcriptional regulator, GntR family domain / Aspartate aminotransferase [Leucobacter sp. 7(1)]|uniref:aminotransferase-like domain-containing protein n=1 Tax=Leucobacter sp. 7(1) TaxID=1255613 RepID=UPI00097F2519|nr:PLP-dependent aminotransferase family protein [Leucobacter sp. 7(1)]SJN08027.1 Transcriptional regulator, GntR family domain / Aspartate aminotransferase [Leucobacter sp. 7(1)]